MHGELKGCPCLNRQEFGNRDRTSATVQDINVGFSPRITQGFAAQRGSGAVYESTSKNVCEASTDFGFVPNGLKILAEELPTVFVPRAAVTLSLIG